jgi:hypothetical protein
LLSKAEKTFCDGILAGMPKTEAYMAAYPRASRASAQAKCSRLLHRERVIAEIVRLRAVADEQPGSALMTLIDKRRYLARVVRARPVLLTYESDLWQTITHSRYCHIYRMPDKIAAIVQDNKLAGHGEDAGMNDWLTQLLASLRT